MDLQQALSPWINWLRATLGIQTRYASLQLTCGNPPDAAQLSFTKEGVALPMIGRPSVLYQTLFRSDSDKSRMEYVLRGNGSVLDDLKEEAKSVHRQISRRDQQKLDEYLSSLRQVEKMLQKQETWLEKPFPETDYALPLLTRYLLISLWNASPSCMISWPWP